MPDGVPQQARRRVGTAPFYSPLRYPGGKRKLSNFLALLFRTNRLLDGEYAEVYAGGSAVALTLLYGEYTRKVHINDLDRGVYAFWIAARDQTDSLCQLIGDARLDVTEWERQRAVQFAAEPDPLDLALSTFYLNRTNRSGIITGGIIGGKNQTGDWKIDARFNRRDLIRRIERIGRWSSRIEIYNLDGAVFLQTIAPKLAAKSLVYLDPPYYVKGQEKLYASYYGPDDHTEVAGLVRGLTVPWVVSYDDHADVRALYDGQRMIAYAIAYSASERYRGREVAFFSDQLLIPDVADPVRLSRADLFGYSHDA
ncbi:MAG: DNA adenine methylase [Chloroflexota bacterium]|nr:DNA adenine methylase [Chloroflexota bacterium]